MPHSMVSVVVMIMSFMLLPFILVVCGFALPNLKWKMYWSSLKVLGPLFGPTKILEYIVAIWQW